MISTKQTLTLKSWFLWGILAATALAACILLGFSPLFTSLMAGSLALKEVLSYFSNFENWILGFSVFTTALLTSSIAVSAFVFFVNIFVRIQDKKKSTLSEQLSLYRSLNLVESNERWLHNTIKKLSKKTGININHIYYQDMFANFSPRKLSNSNLPIDTINQVLNLIQTLKKTLGPNMGAAKIFKLGNVISVRSTVFNGKRKLTRKEITASLAHEFGHLAHSDSLKRGIHLSLYWIAIILGICSLNLFGIGLAITAHFTWYHLQQNKELLADAYSTQFINPDDLISFFKKSESFEETNKKLFPEQPHMGFFNNWSSTHPTDKIRIQILEKIKQEKDPKRKLGY